MSQDPFMVELDDPGQAPRPQDAAPPPDQPQGQAMQRLGRAASHEPSWMAKLFWPVAASLTGLIVTTLAYDWLTATLANRPVLGLVLAGLTAVLLVIMAGAALREIFAYRRLARLDQLRLKAEAALAGKDLKEAQAVSAAIAGLSAAHPMLAPGREAVRIAQNEVLDADTLLAETERHLVTPLDDEARKAVETAARQVAMVTALVPLALADVIAALLANLRMIRRIGEIYGGRGGVIASWRLTRAVLSHLVATGALAAGDDLMESFAGGGLLSKLSRRFGEGLVNGALTARVGVAAIEVTRPLPFIEARQPSASRIIRRSVSGLFGRETS